MNLLQAARLLLGRSLLLGKIDFLVDYSTNLFNFLLTYSFSLHFEVACSLKSDKSCLDSATLQRIMSLEASGSTEPKPNDGKVRISTHTCTQNVVNIIIKTIDTLYIAGVIYWSPVISLKTQCDLTYL